MMSGAMQDLAKGELRKLFTEVEVRLLDCRCLT